MIDAETQLLIRNEQILVCPQCGFLYVHPVGVKVATGDRVTEVDRTGTCVINVETAETRDAASQRGVRIIVEYCCEEGHHGNLIFQFHKGETLVYHEVLPHIEDWAVLWRT